MYKVQYYDFSGKDGKRIKEALKNFGLHYVTISSLPADFFKMSKSQLEKLFRYASDTFISEMYDVPEQQIKKRRNDFGINQLIITLNQMGFAEESISMFKDIFKITSNQYNNGNIPHTNSTQLNSEKEFLYMKATGIVRRIDDLGRIVIPKEIRRTMRIREGDPLEIYTSGEGEVVFKKYSPMGELSGNPGSYAEVLSKMTGVPAAICDRDHVVAAAGIPKRELLERRITPALEEIMESRRCVLSTGNEQPILPIEGVDKAALVCCPIVAGGDVTGSVLLFSVGEAAPNDLQAKLAQIAAAFLSKQMED